MADRAQIKTSAPGSLMLLGEHAVLHGSRAMVCAINLRITVRLCPTGKRLVRISSALGSYCHPLDDLRDHASLRFVLQAIRQHLDGIASGFDLKIDSEFSADIGFGSSAAVTVAVHAALMKWIAGVAPTPHALFNQALQTVHAIQNGRGSGADLAASVFGGVVAFSTAPDFAPIPVAVPLTAVYCGYKTPTPEVIRQVDEKRAAEPEKYARLFAEIDASVPRAIASLNNHDWPAFGKIMNENQQLMTELGVNTPELQEIIMKLQRDPEIFGAKISGSGLGDCAVGIGYSQLDEGYKYPVYHLEITPNGFRCHE